MNYFTIIILIVVLFVIYNMYKREGFDVMDNSRPFNMCSDGYTNFITKDESTCKKNIDIPTCPPKYTPQSFLDKIRCITSQEDINLCPNGFVFDSVNGICKKELPFPVCTEGTYVDDSKICRKFQTSSESPIGCGNNYVPAMDGNDKIIKNKCCPKNDPYYQKKTSGYDKGWACRRFKL